MLTVAEVAGPLMGLPWALGATGPHAYDCWGLCRHALAAIGRPGLPERVEAIPVAARRHGWRRVPDGAQLADGDVLVMWSDGERHVGVVAVLPGQAPRCVHATRDNGVSADPVTLLPALGLRGVEAWRQDAASTGGAQ